MNQSKLFILILLLVLFMVSCSKVLLIPVTLIIMAFFIKKKKYNLALIILSVLFFASMIFNNKIELFQNPQAGGSSQQGKASSQGTSPEPPTETTQMPQLTIPTDTQDGGKNSIHRINISNYNQIFFVFNSLLETKYVTKNRKYIEDIIDNYKINSIFDLSTKVLNKEKNPLYNNFLEKITCLENNSVNYILCDNKNYKKLYAFCELLLVFTLDIDKIVELINKDGIMGVCELSAGRAILESFDNQSSFGYESLGLQYYLNEKSFTRKYFDILKLLELDTFLANDANESHMSLRERLYNYHNSNKEVVKDLNSIMVLFDYYSIFDKYVLNIEDDDYNWDLGILKSVDLNMPCWENVNFFTKYDVKERIIKSINKLTSVDDEFLNRGNPPSNPFDESKNPNLNSINMMRNSNTATEGYVEEEDLFKENLSTFQKRYKTMFDKKQNENKQVRQRLDKKLNLKYLKENFNSKMMEIIDDLALLSKKKCNLECNDTNFPAFSKFSFYVSEVLFIITKKERMMYVGILFVILSIIFNFIIASK